MPLRSDSENFALIKVIGVGGGGSNAGVGMFDNSLTTKARRRAKNFEDRDRGDEEEDGIIGSSEDGRTREFRPPIDLLDS